jgi:hypothetical protein
MSTPAIQIILNSDGTTSFSPSPQTALFSGLVFWNNQTKEHHWPWPTDSNYNPQATGWFPAVPPGETSGDYATPPAVPPPPPQPPQTIYYCCKLHPHRTSERGTITVVSSLP